MSSGLTNSKPDSWKPSTQRFLASLSVVMSPPNIFIEASINSSPPIPVSVVRGSLFIAIALLTTKYLSKALLKALDKGCLPGNFFNPTGITPVFWNSFKRLSWSSDISAPNLKETPPKPNKPFDPPWLDPEKSEKGFFSRLSFIFKTSVIKPLTS